MNSRRILILRRENIGDLVCTTPLIAALRTHLPDAHLAVLANSYNAPILRHQPDLNAVYAYTKGKHAESWAAAGRAHWQRARLLWDLRRQRFDDVVLADPSFVPRNLRLARWLCGSRAAGRVIGFSDGSEAAKRGLDFPVELAGQMGRNVVETVFELARAWDISGPPPPLRLSAETAAPTAIPAGGTVGLHISARKPSQRWPATRFSGLARLLAERHGVKFRLFWSPGDEDHPQHPGDDRKAREVLEVLQGIAIVPQPTERLEQLVEGLAQCQAVICADGGAMHIAAGLGKPLVCLFGDSEAWKWRPWGVPHKLLQDGSHDVANIGVEQVADAFAALQKELATRRGE